MGGRRSVLIVDDQPVNVRVLAESLGEQYRILFARTGARALEIAASGDIDLILLDIVLPDVDGFEVCRRLKRETVTRDVPVIFVTALEEVIDETTGFRVGGVDYITKPINPILVQARVRTHLELKAARDLLENLASIDGLTGIANRRCLDVGLELEWRRAARLSSGLGLALFDVDHFKGFNDLYGHAHGDDCLRGVAQTLAATVRRPGDLVARYGGEEFFAMLPGTELNGLARWLSKVLAQVRELDIPHGGSSCAAVVTLSAGAVVARPTPGTSARAAVAAADRLLYDSKTAGRNRALVRDHDQEGESLLVTATG